MKKLNEDYMVIIDAVMLVTMFSGLLAMLYCVLIASYYSLILSKPWPTCLGYIDLSITLAPGLILGIYLILCKSKKEKNT